MVKRKHINRGLLYSLKRYLRREYRKFKALCLRFMMAVFAVVCIFVFFANSHFSVFNIFGGCDDRVTTDNGSYQGIDVSKYQGNIDWNRVAKDENIQFVYIKASEGASRVDRMYHDYIRGARDAGLKVGSYHYFIGRKSARDQFDNFNRYIDKGKQDLIPMVDVELAGNRLVSRSELQRNLNEFMQLIKDEYGVYPLLYSQYRFYKDNLSPEFDRYFLFLARYGENPPTLDSSGKYNVWQYTEKGRIDGIRGHVDLDRFSDGTSLSDIEL